MNRQNSRLLPAAVSLIVLYSACNQQMESTTLNDSDMKTKEIYFAGGCFWGTEHFFSLVHGVDTTETGYANSMIPDPTYSQVCSGHTGAAETVRVTYNPDCVSLRFLIELFFKTIDPTSLNRQGNDIGTQYRTGIFYTDPTDYPVIANTILALSEQYDRPVVVEVDRLKNFYRAEDYHQSYLKNNPGGYCHLSPAVFRYAREARDPSLSALRRHYTKPSNDSLRSRLTPLQYSVTQEAATELPFSSRLDHEFSPGIYVDITTGQPLFVSSDKFDSGCGWPSFSRPVSPDALTERKDYSHGLSRTEVRSSDGDAHLGHVFDDGPKATGGLRYCINGAALRFIHRDDMESEGYGEYLPLISD